MLLAGLACYAAAAAGCALADSAAVLVAWRTLQGAAMAAILVCARAAVRDLYPAHEGPHILARGLTGLGVVALVAPIAGAWGVQAAGWRWVLVAMVVYSLALLALCWRTFSETRPVQVGPAPVPASVSTGGVRQVFASPGFRAWTALAATTYGGIFCFLLLSPMVYIDLFGLSPVLYGWIPAGGSLVYILSTTWCRRLLLRHWPVRTVQLAAALSLLGPCIQIAGCVLAPDSPIPLLAGHAVYALGNGLHQPCGQAGAVADLPPQLAGRAVSCSGFVIMCVAFCVGQLAAHFVDPTMRHGAWPMVLPMALAGVVLVLIAFVWLPRLSRVRTAQSNC